MPNWAVTLVSALVTQAVILIIYFAGKHSRTKKIQEQISCKKKEIWSIRRELSSMVCSEDKTILNSEYVKQLKLRLKQLKKEIAELNAQLREKDKDNSKLNVTESIKMLDDVTKKIKK